MFKVVASALAILAGLVARDVGKAYGAASSAFDARLAEDAADQARLMHPLGGGQRLQRSRSAAADTSATHLERI